MLWDNPIFNAKSVAEGNPTRRRDSGISGLLDEREKDEIKRIARKYQDGVARDDFSEAFAAEKIAGEFIYPYGTTARFEAARTYAKKLLRPYSRPNPTTNPAAYLPLNIGERSHFEAHGQAFIVGWQQRGVYWLSTDPPGERRRWGTRKQILEDIAYALDTGSLPPPSGRW